MDIRIINEALAKGDQSLYSAAIKDLDRSAAFKLRLELRKDYRAWQDSLPAEQRSQISEKTMFPDGNAIEKIRQLNLVRQVIQPAQPVQQRQQQPRRPCNCSRAKRKPT